jgi:hypothetical protein
MPRGGSDRRRTATAGKRQHGLLRDVVGHHGPAQRPGERDQPWQLGAVEVVEIDPRPHHHGLTSDGHHLGWLTAHVQ